MAKSVAGVPSVSILLLPLMGSGVGAPEPSGQFDPHGRVYTQVVPGHFCPGVTLNR